MSDLVKCPACGKEIAVKGIPRHTNGCPKWDGFSKLPPSGFDFDRYYKRKLWAEGLVEGVDYVVCDLCPVHEHRALRLADHLKLMHKLTTAEYQGITQGRPVVALGSLRRREKTVQERYGVDNVAHAPDVRKKLVENNRSDDPEVVAKRQATNRVRYGHENPLGGEGGKKRAKAGMEAKYGAGNPQQVPEIRERTCQTLKERYGIVEILTPEIVQKQLRFIRKRRKNSVPPQRGTF